MTQDLRPWQRPLLPGGVPRAVQRVLLGELLGLLAHASMQLAITWWISSRGGAAGLTRYGVVTAAAALLSTLLLSPAGDRWPKRRLIRLGRALLVLDAVLLAGLSASGVYDLWLLCACGLLSVAATALLMPVEASLLPELVPSASLPAALRLRRGAQALGALLGPTLGGAVLAGAGLATVMGLNLGLALLAAGAAWHIGTGSGDRHAVAARRRGWWGEMADGLRAKWQVRLDRWWTLVGALMMLCLLPVTGLLLPLRIQALGLSAAWLGACGAALAGGVLLGVAGLAPAAIKRLGRARALALAITLCALAMWGTGLSDQAQGLVVAFACIGLCMSVTQLVGQTHRVLAIPDAYRARMSAAQLTLSQAVAAAAPALAGSLLQHAPVAQVCQLLAGGFAISGLLLLAVPGFGHFLGQDHEGVRNWYARHYPQAFRGL